MSATDNERARADRANGRELITFMDESGEVCTGFVIHLVDVSGRTDRRYLVTLERPNDGGAFRTYVKHEVLQAAIDGDES